MTVFKVQPWLDAQTGYDTKHTFSPDYVWTIEKLWRHWFFPWPRIEVGVVTNLRPAELKAARMAILQARLRHRKEKVRVMRVTELDGKETKTVVWENGHYIDTTILPLWWRIIRWPFTNKRESKTMPPKMPAKAPEKKPEKK